MMFLETVDRVAALMNHMCDKYDSDTLRLADVYVESGLPRCAFWECIQHIMGTNSRATDKWVVETGGSCTKIPGKRGEYDGFGASVPWRFIRKLPVQTKTTEVERQPSPPGNPFGNIFNLADDHANNS